MGRYTYKNLFDKYEICDDKAISRRTSVDINTMDTEHHYTGVAIDKLAEYEDLEEQGLLRKMPCKIGDLLYVLTNDSPTGIEETNCSMIRININGIEIIAPCQYDNWGSAKWYFKQKDIGRVVFLSLEEANEALKK